jgi:antitoxin YefM
LHFGRTVIRLLAANNEKIRRPKAEELIEDNAVRRMEKEGRFSFETKGAHSHERHIPTYSHQQNEKRSVENNSSLENVEDAVAVTKNGVPAAVILSMEKYRSLLETLDILSDEKTMKSLRTSLRQARNGKWVRYDEVFGR